MEQINKETNALELRFTTTAFTLQAKEWEVTENLLDSLCALQQYFQDSAEVLNNFIPQARKTLLASSKQRVYGVDLKQHLRYG